MVSSIVVNGASYQDYLRPCVDALDDNDDRITAAEMLAGAILEDGCERALDKLQSLGLIRYYDDLRPPESKIDFKLLDPDGLVQWFKKQKRAEGKPDFLVHLLNGTIVDVECKNWDAKAKARPNVHGRLWVYFWNDAETKNGKVILGVRPKFQKEWSKGAKKVLLVSRMDIFEGIAQMELRRLFDAIAIVGRKLTEPADDIWVKGIVVDLHTAFLSIKSDGVKA